MEVAHARVWRVWSASPWKRLGRNVSSHCGVGELLAVSGLLEPREIRNLRNPLLARPIESEQRLEAQRPQGLLRARQHRASNNGLPPQPRDGQDVVTVTRCRGIPLLPHPLPQFRATLLSSASRDRSVGTALHRPIPFGLTTLAGLTAAGMLFPPPAPAAQPVSGGETLYTLSTRCSVMGGEATPCTVEAVDEGEATLYRHTIGKNIETVRITADPVTMAIWKSDAEEWRPLLGAAARFSTNTICFNGRELCVVNPNYLNSVRQDSSNSRLQGRDLVMVLFGEDGRVDASCYDDACKRLLK